MESLEKGLGKANEAKPEGFIEKMAVAIVREEFEASIRSAQTSASLAKAIVADAKEKFAIVQRDCPLEVEFVGAGL